VGIRIETVPEGSLRTLRKRRDRDGIGGAICAKTQREFRFGLELAEEIKLGVPNRACCSGYR
jgi:hypothetical protein